MGGSQYQDEQVPAAEEEFEPTGSLRWIRKNNVLTLQSLMTGIGGVTKWEDVPVVPED